MQPIYNLQETNGFSYIYNIYITYPQPSETNGFSHVTYQQPAKTNGFSHVTYQQPRE